MLNVELAARLPVLFSSALRLDGWACARRASNIIVLALRPRTALIAENLFLRKQLALFKERNQRPRRADNATRWLLAALSALFDWRSATRRSETRYAHPLASQRFQDVLALEVQAKRPPEVAEEYPRVGQHDGG